MAKVEIDVTAAIHEVMQCRSLNHHGRRDVVRILKKLFKVPSRVFAPGSKVTVFDPLSEVCEECIIAFTGVKTQACRLISLTDGRSMVTNTVHVYDVAQISEEEVLLMAGEGFEIK